MNVDSVINQRLKQNETHRHVGQIYHRPNVLIIGQIFFYFSDVENAHEFGTLTPYFASYQGQTSSLNF